jgi:hypothetical protein
MNFKAKKSILKIYLFIAIAVGAGLTVWRTVLLKEYCNPYDMSFQDGALPALELFEYVLLAVLALLATSAIFLRKTEFGLFGARASTTSVSICAICGFILAVVGVFAMFCFPYEIFDFYDEALKTYHIFLLITVALMFVSALYFFGRASTALKNSPSVATLSLALPCFAIAYLISSYFNADLPLLDFNRVTSEIAFICVLMFMLSEARLATDQRSYPFRFAASLITIVSVCSYIAPLLLLAAFWEMDISLSLLMEVSLVPVLFYATFAAFNAIRTLKQAEEAPLS